MSKVVRFHYLHRDSGNYKKFGSIDFANPANLSVQDLEKQIRTHLIDSSYFYPEKIGIPKFEFHRLIDDYSWYEFDFIEVVKSKRQKGSIEEFIFKLEKSKQ